MSERWRKGGVCGKQSLTEEYYKVGLDRLAGTQQAFLDALLEYLLDALVKKYIFLNKDFSHRTLTDTRVV